MSMRKDILTEFERVRRLREFIYFYDETKTKYTVARSVEFQFSDYSNC